MARTSRSMRAQVQSSASAAETVFSSSSLWAAVPSTTSLNKGLVGVAAHAALARLAGSHLQELLDDVGGLVLAFLPLIERLHGRESRGLPATGQRLRIGHEFRQRRCSATMARQAWAASPPLSPRCVSARALACSMVFTVTMP